MKSFFAKLLIGALLLTQLVGHIAESHHSRGSGSFSAPASAPGVKVGTGGVLVSTLTGATVNLTIQGYSGGFFGTNPDRMAGVAAATSAQIAQGITDWNNTLPTAGKPYGLFNAIRLMVNSCDWEGCTGIDPYNNSGQAAGQYFTVGTDTNGRTVYSAAPSCASNAACLGTGPGHEVSGNPSVYQNEVKQAVTNIEGASAILGYQMHVILVIQWTAPPWHTTGQLLLPLDQPAMPAPIDLLVLNDWAALYGNDPAVLIEPYNEPYGTNNFNNLSGNESKFLGNGNGSATTYQFPTTTTSPDASTSYNYTMAISGAIPAMGGGGTAGSPNTAGAISAQQAVNTLRAGGFHGVVIANTLNATCAPQTWAPAGGTYTYSDPYSIGGVQQSAAGYHFYCTFGTVAIFTAIQAAGVPIIGTEGGSVVGNGGTSCGYVCWRSHNWSTAVCCNANFGVPPLTNIYPNDGSSYSNAWTIQHTSSGAQGLNPWNNPNVPVGNTGSNTTQIPTGSN